MQHDVKKFLSKINFGDGLILTSPIETDLALDAQGVLLEVFDKFGVRALFDQQAKVYTLRKKENVVPFHFVVGI